MTILSTKFSDEQKQKASERLEKWRQEASDEEKKEAYAKSADKRRKNDGLDRSQRYRLKNLDQYRENKAAYARTPAQRKVRSEYMKKWRDKNREKHNEAHRAYYHKHKEERREAYASYALISNFGITLEQKKRMLEKQDSRCLICGKNLEIGRNCHIDHCHEAGNIRGILCGSCNTKLGWFEDHRSVIINYLRVGAIIQPERKRPFVERKSRQTTNRSLNGIKAMQMALIDPEKERQRREKISVTMKLRKIGKGVGNAQSKLSEQDVSKIRERLATGEGGSRIARHYGVSPRLISMIKTGKRHAIDGK